jgi:hypothetical protein
MTAVRATPTDLLERTKKKERKRPVQAIAWPLQSYLELRSTSAAGQSACAGDFPAVQGCGAKAAGSWLTTDGIGCRGELGPH